MHIGFVYVRRNGIETILLYLNYFQQSTFYCRTKIIPVSLFKSIDIATLWFTDTILLTFHFNFVTLIVEYFIVVPNTMITKVAEIIIYEAFALANKFFFFISSGK